MNGVLAVSKGEQDPLKARGYGPGHRVRANAIGIGKPDGIARDRIITASGNLNCAVRIGRRVCTRCRLEKSVIGDRPTGVAQVRVERQQNAIRRAARTEEIGNVVVRDDVAGIEQCGIRSSNGCDPIEGRGRAIVNITVIDCIVVVSRHASGRAKQHDATRRRRIDARDRAVAKGIA